MEGIRDEIEKFRMGVLVLWLLERLVFRSSLPGKDSKAISGLDLEQAANVKFTDLPYH
jgi:hypothetical protein